VTAELKIMRRDPQLALSPAMRRVHARVARQSLERPALPVFLNGWKPQHDP
jgi:hypothetical protein